MYRIRQNESIYNEQLQTTSRVMTILYLFIDVYFLFRPIPGMDLHNWTESSISPLVCRCFHLPVMLNEPTRELLVKRITYNCR